MHTALNLAAPDLSSPPADGAAPDPSRPLAEGAAHAPQVLEVIHETRYDYGRIYPSL